MGCGRSAYWIGNLIFDIMMFSSSNFCMYLFPFIMGLDFFYHNMDHYMPFVLLSFGFGFGLITFSYIFGFFFVKSNTAYKSFPFLFPIITLLFPLIMLAIPTHKDNDGYSVNYGIDYSVMM